MKSGRWIACVGFAAAAFAAARSSFAGGGAADSLDLRVEPEAGELDAVFTFTLSNVGAEDFLFDGCCVFPEITSVSDGRKLPLCIYCEPCGPKPVLEVLPAGGSLRHEWRAEDATCAGDWTPAPGLYEVRWTGFPEDLVARFELLAIGPPRFLRGDTNADASVDISDMIYLLVHLFLGGPGPGCPDIADINDDGGVDIADPVSGFDYLFRGGPEPPAPGPEVPGFDGTPTDPFPCGDPPPAELPGARFDLSTIPDSLTLAEAAAGVIFRYAVVIEEDLHVASLPLDAGRCDAPGPSGLRLFERISGDGQNYCLCDVGLCLPQTQPSDLRAGRYEEQFEWTGRNWFGPSDTNNPLGAPFPPGRYSLEVQARGTYRGPRATELVFESAAAKEFELLP